MGYQRLNPGQLYGKQVPYLLVLLLQLPRVSFDQKFPNLIDLLPSCQKEKTDIY